MNKFLATIKSGMASFARDEEGAQIVEYALIIAGKAGHAAFYGG